MHTWLVNWLIYFNGMSTRLELFYAEKLGIRLFANDPGDQRL